MTHKSHLRGPLQQSGYLWYHTSCHTILEYYHFETRESSADTGMLSTGFLYYWLQSDEFAALKEGLKTGAILSHISGSISFIASTALVWHILRSHDGLFKTFHRLLFGLCIADIISSCSHMLASMMVPHEMD